MAERARQQSVEGYTPEHDDEHGAGELAGAAACYALWGVMHWAARQGAKDFWPWSLDHWKPGDHRDNLVKAGALILAEIERLYRAALTGRQG